MSHLSNVWFKVTDLQVATGRGCRVTTADGHEYLDFAAGIAVNSTGHCHPKVTAAIAAQAERFIHAQANVFTHDLMEPLAAKLNDITPPSIDTFFFANSGAEITEAAVKLAKQITKRQNVIVFQGSFHGRTHLAMAMTTSKTIYRAGHAPLPSGIFVSPFPDPLASDQEATINASLRAFDRLLLTQTAPSETAAVIVEPVLGEGGYIPAPAAFIEGIAQRCREHGIMFIADEVQSGFARTGAMFACEDEGIEPDLIITAKGIADGLPLSGVTGRAEIMDAPHVSGVGGTYGGNPLACAAALATIETIELDGLLDRAKEIERLMKDRLGRLQADDDRIGDVRGRGAMIAVELVKSGTAEPNPELTKALCAAAHAQGVIVLSCGTFGNVLRFLPPLTISDDLLTEGLDVLAGILAEL